MRQTLRKNRLFTGIGRSVLRTMGLALVALLSHQHVSAAPIELKVIDSIDPPGRPLDG